jgi:SAM-dependent methyltransferase
MSLKDTSLEDMIYMDTFTLHDGIYMSREELPALSYPDEGNEHCFAVEADSFWFNHRNGIIKASMELLPPDKVLFDVGGGNGFVSAFLNAGGYNTILFEPGEQGAKNAKTRGVDNIFCALFDKKTIRSASVPAVGIFDVLEHIENDKEFLEEILDLLKLGGNLYITVPAHRWLWSFADARAGHFRRYNMTHLKGKLKSLGYEVPYASYFFRPLPLPLFLARKVLKIGKNGRIKNDVDHKQARTQHAPGTLGKLLLRFLQREIVLVKRGKVMRFGGSVLIIAQKPGVAQRQ